MKPNGCRNPDCNSTETDRIIASKIGGLGVCGRELCCATWLKDACKIQVNLRMARKQKISLTPENLNGFCSHMKCCIRFEAPPESLIPAEPKKEEQ